MSPKLTAAVLCIQVQCNLLRVSSAGDDAHSGCPKSDEASWVKHICDTADGGPMLLLLALFSPIPTAPPLL